MESMNFLNGLKDGITISEQGRVRMNKTEIKRPIGWHGNDWYCPNCGQIYGLNLLGQKPYALVGEHRKVCRKEFALAHIIEQIKG